MASTQRGLSPSSSNDPGASPEEPRSTINLLSSSLHKVANIVMGSRQTQTQPDKKIVNRSCNLVSDEYENIKRNLKIWTDPSIPLCITVSLVNPQLCPLISVNSGNTFSSDLILEKWYFLLVPTKDFSGKKDDLHSRNKKIILFARTFANLIRFLPAYRIYRHLTQEERKLSSMRITVETINQIPKRPQDTGMAPGTIESIPIAPIDTIHGTAVATVYFRTECYRKNTSKKTQSGSSPMNIINDYAPDSSLPTTTMAVSKPRSITNQSSQAIVQPTNRRTGIVGSYEPDPQIPLRDRSQSLPSTAMMRPGNVGLSSSFRNTPPTQGFVYSDVQPVPVPYASSPFGALVSQHTPVIEDTVATPPFTSSLPQPVLRPTMDMSPDIIAFLNQTPPLSHPSDLAGMTSSSAGRSFYFNKASMAPLDTRPLRLNVTPFRKDGSDGLPRTNSGNSLLRAEENLPFVNSTPSSFDAPTFAAQSYEDSDSGLGRFVRECQTAVPLKLFHAPEKPEGVEKYKHLRQDFFELLQTKNPDSTPMLGPSILNNPPHGEGLLPASKFGDDHQATDHESSYPIMPLSGVALSTKGDFGQLEYIGQELLTGAKQSSAVEYRPAEDLDAPFA